MHNIKVEGRKVSKAHWLFIWDLLADECKGAELDVNVLSQGRSFTFTRTSCFGRVDVDVQLVNGCIIFKCW
ncbi:hypothetical protein VP496E541_P0110 [Vibrio phage 496E54-1]|nr:hypothetical protein VP495E541_P0111 [Vibrio phage 495E54-1]CAH9013627.1 hypothetical protein VP496E541_P0110 [Vibrio phage 496E54-1]